jgi:hypothetical protein
MSNLSPDETDKAKKYLTGIIVWSWIAIALVSAVLILSALTLSTNLKDMSILPPSNDVIYLPFIIPFSIIGIIFGFVSAILYAIAIIGINKRKRFSVKLIQTLLILTIFSIPVGTIVGALLLRRINNPLVRDYFNNQ